MPYTCMPSEEARKQTIFFGTSFNNAANFYLQCHEESTMPQKFVKKPYNTLAILYIRMPLEETRMQPNTPMGVLLLYQHPEYGVVENPASIQPNQADWMTYMIYRESGVLGIYSYWWLAREMVGERNMDLILQGKYRKVVNTI
jgi:hypothetical protein